MKKIVFSLIFILLIGLSQNLIQAEPLFQERSLAEAAKDRLVWTTLNKIEENSKVLILDFDFSLEQLSANPHCYAGFDHLNKKNYFDIVVAYHPSLKRLSEIKEALKPGGIVLLTYFPSESPHWRLIERVKSQNYISKLNSIKDYQAKIETLGFSIKEAPIYRDFAIYQDKQELMAEIQNEPRLWGYLTEKLEALTEIAQQESLAYTESGKILIPYKMFDMKIIKN